MPWSLWAGLWPLPGSRDQLGESSPGGRGETRGFNEGVRLGEPSVDDGGNVEVAGSVLGGNINLSAKEYYLNMLVYFITPSGLGYHTLCAKRVIGTEPGPEDFPSWNSRTNGVCSRGTAGPRNVQRTPQPFSKNLPTTMAKMCMEKETADMIKAWSTMVRV